MLQEIRVSIYITTVYSQMLSYRMWSGFSINLFTLLLTAETAILGGKFGAHILTGRTTPSLIVNITTWTNKQTNPITTSPMWRHGTFMSINAAENDSNRNCPGSSQIPQYWYTAECHSQGFSQARVTQTVHPSMGHVLKRKGWFWPGQLNIRHMYPVSMYTYSKGYLSMP